MIHKRVWITRRQLLARDKTTNLLLWPGIETIMISSLPQVMRSYHNFLDYIGLARCRRPSCATPSSPFDEHPFVHCCSLTETLRLNKSQWNANMSNTDTNPDHGLGYPVTELVQNAMLVHGSFWKLLTQRRPLCRRMRVVVPLPYTKEERLEYLQNELAKARLELDEGLPIVKDFLDDEEIEVEDVLRETMEMEFFNDQTSFKTILLKELANDGDQYDRESVVMCAKDAALMEYVEATTAGGKIPSTLLYWIPLALLTHDVIDDVLSDESNASSDESDDSDDATLEDASEESDED